MKFATFVWRIHLLCLVQYMANGVVSQMFPDSYGDSSSAARSSANRPSAYGDSSSASRPSAYGDSSSANRPSAYGDSSSASRPAAYGDSSSANRPSAYGESSSGTRSSANRPSPTSSSENRSPAKNCNADARKPWSYTQRNGPDSWGSKYRACDGLIQSPIAIRTSDLIKGRELPKIAMNGYDIPLSKATIQNNGRTVTVTPDDNIQRSILVNGTTYILSGFHFHWGEHPYGGSEHSIDGTRYAMELHFVHESVKKNTAVVAVFFEELDNLRNEDLRPIIEILSQVSYKDMKTHLRNRLQLNSLLPANPCSFFRYIGSLTTPGCDEGVIWSLLTPTVMIGTKQMAEFRKLYSTRKSEASSNCKLSDNHRPVQPLNYRTVFMSE